MWKLHLNSPDGNLSGKQITLVKFIIVGSNAGPSNKQHESELIVEYLINPPTAFAYTSAVHTMPPSQNDQNCLRFATLFADTSKDPSEGNNIYLNKLFSANISNPTEPSAIKSIISTATLRGQGLTSLLAMVNGKLGKLFAPFTYVPGMGAPPSDYRDQTIAFNGDMMGRSSYHLSKLPEKFYHQTAHAVTLKPDNMASFFVDNPTATSVGPFDQTDEQKPEMEKIKSRHSTYLPHSLGALMCPEHDDDLTVPYFWIKVYPVIVSEGTQEEHQHLIQFFQLAATLKSEGGASFVNHGSPFEAVTRDEGVYETVEQCILDRLFPSRGGSGSTDSSGMAAVAKEIGELAAGQQQRDEEAKARQKKKEEEKYALKKLLGIQALKRFKVYNGLHESSSDAMLVAKGVPFFEKLDELKPTKESEVLKALQEAVEYVLELEGVDLEDAIQVTPDLLKALLDSWERVDTDSLVTGIGANLFLHGPKCAEAAEEMIQVFHATLSATNAPDAEVLKKLYSGKVFVPAIGDVGYNLRSMMWFMKAVTIPGHPHVMSLKKVLHKWTCVERNFTLRAMSNNDPTLGIYLLEALNMLMNDYWVKQKAAEGELINGWDGCQVFTDIKNKKNWKPLFSPKYIRTLKLELFQGVYGSHVITTDGGNKGHVTVESAGAASNASKTSNLQQGDKGKKNEHYNSGLFERFKKRKDPATGQQYPAKNVRRAATKPLPNSKTGKGPMCMAWHVKERCNENCPCSNDHIPYTEEEYAPLVAWCEECYPGSDM